MLAWGLQRWALRRKITRDGFLSRTNRRPDPYPRGVRSRQRGRRGAARDAPRSALRCIRRCSTAAPAPPREWASTVAPAFPPAGWGRGSPSHIPPPPPHPPGAVRPAFPARDMAGSSEKAPDSGRGVVVNANSGFPAPLALSPPLSSLRGTPPLPPPNPLADKRSGENRPRLCSSSGRRPLVFSHPGLPSPPGLTKLLLKSLLHPEFPITPPFPPSPRVPGLEASLLPGPHFCYPQGL